MLIKTQKAKEVFLIGKHGEIKITLLELSKNKIRIGIDAPSDMPILKYYIADICDNNSYNNKNNKNKKAKIS
ncbi:MAG: carbon storage regulator [Candidatus Pacearchaeota archaeon]|jgi:carbon storage regulator CsrA